jgi:hypothetical protein
MVMHGSRWAVKNLAAQVKQVLLLAIVLASLNVDVAYAEGQHALAPSAGHLLSPMSYGAAGNCSTDDSAAIAQASSAASASGSYVLIEL